MTTCRKDYDRLSLKTTDSCLGNSVTDDLLANAERYADSFDKGDLPLPPALHVAVVESVRGFVYEVETGKLREVR